MVLGILQKYIIAGFLLIIGLNAVYSAFLYNSRTKAYTERDKAYTEKQLAINETNEVKAERDTIQKSLDKTREELEAARASIKVREEEIDKINKAKEATDGKLKKALDGSSDWSNQPVPDGVRNVLKETNQSGNR